MSTTRRSPTAADSPPFNLRGLVREVLDNSVLADPGQIADEVYRRTPPKDRAEAYRQALRHFVRQVVSEERARTTIVTPNRSAKVTGIREWWQRSLMDRVHAGEHRWVLLRDCTRDDLLFAASERREQAERNRAKAAQYESLATLLDDNGAATVRDLPADVLMRALGGAA